MSRPIAAVISTKNMAHNLSTVGDHFKARAQVNGISSKQIKVFAIVKANCYGHTLQAAVQGFELADGLGTIEPESLTRLRELGWKKSLLLLEGIFDHDDLSVVQQTGAITAIHCQEQIELLASSDADTSAFDPPDVLIKINSGMNRLGFRAPAMTKAYQELVRLQGLNKVGKIGFMSHFADADGQQVLVEQPAEYIQNTIEDYPGVISVSNSAATLRYPDLLVNNVMTHKRDLIIRPGICLYGSSPMGMTQGETAADFDLKPSMNLRAKILTVQELKKGEAVGYGSTYVASSDERIAVVACGYADGYPRSARNGTPTVINGQIAPIAGRVSMDMLTINISHLPEVKAGDWVDLWGGQGPTIDEVAHSCGRISYELLTGVSARVPRIIE